MDFTKKNCRAMMLFWVVMLNVGSMASLLAVVVGCDHHVGTNTSAYMGHKYVDLQLPSGRSGLQPIWEAKKTNWLQNSIRGVSWKLSVLTQRTTISGCLAIRKNMAFFKTSTTWLM